MTATETETHTPGQTEAPAPGTWVIDAAHSSIEATARHMMISKVRGAFESFSGTVEVAADPTASSVDVSIDAKSINTGVDDRDQHLRSGDFLDADNHPQLTFESSEIEHVEGDRYRMVGDLTIRGETHAIELDVKYFGKTDDPAMGPRAAFEATTELDREQWDITWNKALETGGVLVGKTLDVELNIALVPAEDDNPEG